MLGVGGESVDGDGGGGGFSKTRWRNPRFLIMLKALVGSGPVAILSTSTPVICIASCVLLNDY
jgi:hypothetical protein